MGFRRFVYLFVNPLNFETPLGARLSALPAIGLFIAGCLASWRREKALFGMLALPILFVLVASCLRLYPFHGRLVLFLVPSLLLLIAEGAGWFRETFGGGLTWALLLGALLLFPSLGAFYHLVEMHERRDFSPYGDRRATKLDPIASRSEPHRFQTMRPGGPVLRLIPGTRVISSHR